MGEREDLSRIRKGDRSFSRRVKGAKEVYECGDKAEMCRAAFGYIKGHACCKQGPEHIGESEEKKTTTPKGIDSPDGRPGKDKVDETEAEGGQQSSDVVGTSSLEDSRRIEGNDVDCMNMLAYPNQNYLLIKNRDKLTSAHLLGNHDNSRGLSGTTNTGDSEKLNESGEEVVRLDQTGLHQQGTLMLKLGMNKVDISSSL